MSIQHPYLDRIYGEKLTQLGRHFPVVVVSGARQVGKSTLLSHLFPDWPRVVFDPIVDVENARQDPDLFLKNRRAPLILDEIQYAPELVPAIKRLLENDKHPGQYIITGSQQWGVMKVLAESLAGRAVFLDLEGFCVMEIAKVPATSSWLCQWLNHHGKISELQIAKSQLPTSLYEQLWRGFLPEAQFIPKDVIPDYLAAYQRTYIERDVRLIAEVGDLTQFNNFFRLCAALTAQEINHSQLGRELDMSPQTARRWLDILKVTFQWHEIPAYAGNTIKRISEKSKGYLADTGMICHAHAISAPEVVGGHPLWGAIFETAVMNDIRKQSRLLPTPPTMYHWRSHGGAEVDLILEWNGKFFPIEIKGKSHPTTSDVNGIYAFRKTYPKLQHGPGLVVAPVDSFYPVADDIWAIPWDAFIK